MALFSLSPLSKVLTLNEALCNKNKDSLGTHAFPHQLIAEGFILTMKNIKTPLCVWIGIKTGLEKLEKEKLGELESAFSVQNLMERQG
jgi:hypothetical protein